MSLHPTQQSDLSVPFSEVPVGGLQVTDLGYFNTDHFQRLAVAGRYYLSRVTVLTDAAVCPCP